MIQVIEIIEPSSSQKVFDALVRERIFSKASDSQKRCASQTRALGKWRICYLLTTPYCSKDVN